MEDIIVSVPQADAKFIAQLLERMGCHIKTRKFQGQNPTTFHKLFDQLDKESTQDHEWSLEEINAEINAARQSRIQPCMQ